MQSIEGFDRKLMCVHAPGACKPHHLRRCIDTEHLNSTLHEVGCIHPRAAAQIEEPVSAIKQRVNPTPDGGSLLPADGALGPQRIISFRKSIEHRADGCGAHAPNSWIVKYR